MVLNQKLRQGLHLRPHPVGTAPWRDAVKSGVWRTSARVAHALGRHG